MEEVRETEIMMPIKMHMDWMHPQRELNDSIIDSEEVKRDIQKRIEEYRHEAALKCVAFGIYKDVYEAKQGIRSKSCLDETLYRAKDRAFKLQVQASVV
jgi:hypothetical protein